MLFFLYLLFRFLFISLFLTQYLIHECSMKLCIKRRYNGYFIYFSGIRVLTIYNIVIFCILLSFMIFLSSTAVLFISVLSDYCLNFFLNSVKEDLFLFCGVYRYHLFLIRQIVFLFFFFSSFLSYNHCISAINIVSVVMKMCNIKTLFLSFYSVVVLFSISLLLKCL